MRTPGQFNAFASGGGAEKPPTSFKNVFDVVAAKSSFVKSFTPGMARSKLPFPAAPDWFVAATVVKFPFLFKNSLSPVPAGFTPAMLLVCNKLTPMSDDRSIEWNELSPRRNCVAVPVGNRANGTVPVRLVEALSVTPDTKAPAATWSADTAENVPSPFIYCVAVPFAITTPPT